MSYELTKQAMSVETGSPMTKLVLLALCDYANNEKECWPSIIGVANKCEMSRSTVIRHIESLRKRGFLKKKKSIGSNNRYSIKLPECQSDTSITEEQVSERNQYQSATSIREIPTSVTEELPLVSEWNTNKSINKPITNQYKELPHFIDKPLWDDFILMRNKLKCIPSERALNTILNNLCKWENETKGNANMAILKAIEHSWKTVYKPKHQSNFKNGQADNITVPPPEAYEGEF